MKLWKVLVIALMLVLGAALAQQRPRVVIPTGSTGGVFFFYGQAIAKLLSESGVADATAQQTGGSYDNLLLLRDRTDPASRTYYCALATTDSALVTYTGEEPRFAQRKADMQRIMFYMYPSLIHIVTTENSGIKFVGDLRGKRVSTGQPGSSTENLALLVLKGAGVDVREFAKRERLPAAESAKALSEGTIDAYFWVGGVPTASVVELAQSLARKGDQIKLVDSPRNGPTAQLLMKEFPGIITTGVLPKAAYGTKDNVFALYTGNVFLCPASMPDDLAAAIMKAVFSNLQTLVTATAAARDTTIKNTVDLYNQKVVIPFHPGALRYLRETGAIR
ncbi:MAG: TAXI family TRAP transporter solute-binding subunit [Meiothermus sp.]|uniref:TAXI family TRAP transporter solute-binding subunit n=1 Tax=Meiothermus sp. TaxID=1955249 RepID=UPI0025F016E5|nr:TAXI family TRAP transporter solute-binding subunit [Meiothermus sp.]MCS7067787.1 TAXI family TRAP transporter solute-binding subunit [Meiothermus sp.]MCX7601934.1 TAXI family TRAP transporter solute-binding subunit [Meiothermus sp.]MDW8425252.1 TAXI family TRAP transporter solute-binding subunit [Meiothermus sp.]